MQRQTPPWYQCACTACHAPINTQTKKYLHSKGGVGPPKCYKNWKEFIQLLKQINNQNENCIWIPLIICIISQTTAFIHSLYLCIFWSWCGIKSSGCHICASYGFYLLHSTKLWLRKQLHRKDNITIAKLTSNKPLKLLCEKWLCHGNNIYFWHKINLMGKCNSIASKQNLHTTVS